MQIKFCDILTKFPLNDTANKTWVVDIVGEDVLWYQRFWSLYLHLFMESAVVF